MVVISAKNKLWIKLFLKKSEESVNLNHLLCTARIKNENQSISKALHSLIVAVNIVTKAIIECWTKKEKNIYKKKEKKTRATAIPFDSNRKYCRIFEEWPSIVELRNEAVLALRWTLFCVYEIRLVPILILRTLFRWIFFSMILFIHKPPCVSFNVVYVFQWYLNI